jgi:dihydrofolate reductase
MGGAQIYSESLALPLSSKGPSVDRILMTRILSPEFDCDVFLDNFEKEGKGEWKREPHKALQEWVGFEVPEGEQEENGIKYEFQMWSRGTEA